MVPPEPVVARPDADLDSLPEGPAVYMVWPRGGRPHLGRTSILRRRIKRLFDKWNLAETADRVEYWPAASKLEQWLVSYALARVHFPDTFARVLKLPKPAYVRLILANDFPRTQVTTRFAGPSSLFYGPFATRPVADQFEAQMLEQFQLRRCQEELAPSPQHPGCIYGEMRMCLRPCQSAVSAEEYATEAERVRQFLAGRGANLLDAAAAARDRFSEEMNFEEAARQHQRYEKILGVVRVGGDLAREVGSLDGVAVLPSTEPQSVLLWFLRGGCWLDAVPFSLAPGIGEPMDKRLRTVAEGLPEPRLPLSIKQDHLSLLAKWYYSSWRDGEWLGIDDWSRVPYRKLVNAISRVRGAARGADPGRES
jgi:excinuclease UvrABC nuclease subunit